ncbi:MAG: hypothetical protein ACRELY_23545 [Polyangiaceae bacterium]
MRGAPVVVALAATLFFASGCATYHDDLVRGEKAFEDNQHEQALAIFRVLEQDTSHLDPPERARYYYLRGMTDYRVGYKADARHWLMLAQASEKAMPGTLPDDWKQHMSDAMGELDSQVYDQGVPSLTSVETKPSSDKVDKAPDDQAAPHDDQPAPQPAPKVKNEDVP